MRILVTGSIAYDYIMVFPGRFRDHILPDKMHVLSVSFLVDSLQRRRGGTAANIAYNLALLGERLSLIHLVALQFVVGVGLDYALFFARRQLDRDERARTLRTLVTCCATTMLTFGLLLLCRTPLLRDIGATVAIGVLAAMCFAFVLAGVRPGEEDAG